MITAKGPATPSTGERSRQPAWGRRTQRGCAGAAAARRARVAAYLDGRLGEVEGGGQLAAPRP